MKNQLVCIYLPLVHYHARKVFNTLPEASFEREDLASVGVFGLMQAIGTFDLERGIKFESYCVPRIRGAMLDFIRTEDIVPRLLRARLNTQRKVVDAFRMQHQRDPDDAEKAEAMGMTMEEYTQLLQDMEGMFTSSLDKKIGENDMGNTVNQLDNLRDRRERTPRSRWESDEFWKLALAGLNKKERVLIISYYVEGLTMKEVGEQLGLSESRVSQMHSSILERTRERLLLEEERDPVFISPPKPVFTPLSNTPSIPSFYPRHMGTSSVEKKTETFANGHSLNGPARPYLAEEKASQRVIVAAKETAEAVGEVLDPVSSLPPVIRKRADALFDTLSASMNAAEAAGKHWIKTEQEERALVELCGLLYEYGGKIPELAMRLKARVNAGIIRKWLPKYPSIGAVEARVIELLQNELITIKPARPDFQGRRSIPSQQKTYVIALMRLLRKRDLGGPAATAYLGSIGVLIANTSPWVKNIDESNGGISPLTEDLIKEVFERARAELGLMEEAVGEPNAADEAREPEPVTEANAEELPVVGEDLSSMEESESSSLPESPTAAIAEPQEPAAPEAVTTEPVDMEEEVEASQSVAQEVALETVVEPEVRVIAESSVVAESAMPATAPQAPSEAAPGFARTAFLRELVGQNGQVLDLLTDSPSPELARSLAMLMGANATAMNMVMNAEPQLPIDASASAPKADELVLSGPEIRIPSGAEGTAVVMELKIATKQ